MIHDPSQCKGQYCTFHNPSPHHMRNWPKVVRMSALTERQCTHGVGHPDPDSLSWMERQGIEGYDIHGCDGCCTPTTFHVIDEDGRLLAIPRIPHQSRDSHVEIGTLQDEYDQATRYNKQGQNDPTYWEGYLDALDFAMQRESRIASNVSFSKPDKYESDAGMTSGEMSFTVAPE